MYAEDGCLEFVLKKDIPYFTDCEPLVQGLGYKLVDLNVFNKSGVWQAKAVIHAENGVGIKDCAAVHRAIQPRLEALLGSQELSVEVSSPGINRQVKRSVELAAFIGGEAEIWDSGITDWRRGVLKEVSGAGVLLVSDGKEILLPYDNIKKARCNL